jgi:hypothetical protein
MGGAPKRDDILAMDIRIERILLLKFLKKANN